MEVRTLTEQLTKTRVPLLAIVGRPNVGKSTLFNRMIGSRRAIVGDEPGITRDRLYSEAVWNNRRLRVVDTGGIIPDEKELIPSEIFRQARVALEEADAIVMVVDCRTELASPDLELARLLRRLGPLILIKIKMMTRSPRTATTLKRRNPLLQPRHWKPKSPSLAIPTWANPPCSMR